MRQITWIVMGWVALVSAVQAASFNCEKAATTIEKMICDDAELSELDGDLSEVYQQSIGQSKDKTKEVSEQKLWLKTVRNSCQNVDCLKNVYQARFDVLTRAQTQEENRESDSAQYTVRCDKDSRLLIVSDSALMPKVGNQSPNIDVLEYTINPDRLTKVTGTDMDARILPEGRKLYRCKLGSVLYKVTIEPHIENSNPNGECGAAGPDISLSVRRNGKQILSGIEFEHCRFGSHSGRTINRIQFFEAASTIKVLAIPNDIFLPIRVERTFSLTSPPTDWQKAIFEDYPTGDADADFFIAVYRRDIAAIKQAIQSGANPNAMDLNGFPPLAHIVTGREDAYRKKKLDEFNHQSDEMAKILFAAGASANAKNIHGVTLLDYLIVSNMPDSIIDMLLAHGANVQQGEPLVRAASRADEYLVKKLIDSGANPNLKAQDGTTALWGAASTGFYSYNAWDTPSITDYAKCVRLLLQRGAKIQEAVKDSMGMPWSLVTFHGKDERLKIILAELMPYMNRDEIGRTQKLAEKYSSTLAQWIKDHTH